MTPDEIAVFAAGEVERLHRLARLDDAPTAGPPPDGDAAIVPHPPAALQK